MSALSKRARALAHLPASRRRAGVPGLSTLIGAAVGLLALGLLIRLSHPVRTWQALQRVPPGYLGLALLLDLPVVWLRSLRAGILLRRLGWRVPAGRMLLVQLVGQSSSSLSPAATGDAVRAYLWHREVGAPLGAGLAVVAFERVSSLLLMAGLGIACSAPVLWSGPAAILGMVMGVTAALAPLWAAKWLPTWARRTFLRRPAGVPVVGHLAGRLGEPLDDIRTMLAGPGVVPAIAGLTMAAFVLAAMQVWLLAAGAGGPIPLWAGLGAYGLSQVGGILSTLPFGLGAGDLLLDALLTRIGDQLSAGVSVAVLLRAVTTVPFAVAATAAYPLLRRSRPRVSPAVSDRLSSAEFEPAWPR